MLVSDLYCPSCRNAKDHKPQDNEICWSCVAMGGAGNYKESKTHGDQLRAMTDEELATFLTNNQVEVFRKVVKEMCSLLDIPFPYEELTKEVTAKYEEIKKEQLEWLKQEANDNA